MASMAAEDDDLEELRVEEALPWLPTQVLQEACDIKVHARQPQQNHFQPQRRLDRSQLSPSDLAFSANRKSMCGSVYSPPHWRPNPPSAAANWTGGGSEMRAVYLDSGGHLGGTGVFLPRGTGGTGSQPNKKPGCSMILVPARVVKALNLNVHALGSQTSPNEGLKSNPIGGRECNSEVKNKEGKDVTSTHCSFISQNQTNSSQEIFLPKEWTY